VIVEEAPWTREQVVESVLEAVADEIHRLLEEGVVDEAADVDHGLLLGAGWPFFLGGITKHLDQTGISERLFGHPLSESRAGLPA
jgi:3-hydroxyacyl-CoA dehydrogenase